MGSSFNHTNVRAPFIKDNVQDNDVLPMAQVMANSAPQQSLISRTSEDKQSREIVGDLQRRSITYIWIVRGRPDVAAEDKSIADFSEGKAHPYADFFFVQSVSFRHRSFGGDVNPEGLDTEPAQSWTQLTVVYVQRPCPAMFEESQTTSVVSRLEWYSRRGPLGDEATPVQLRGTLQPVSILVPVPVYTRRFLKVKLTDDRIKILDDNVGTVNRVDDTGNYPKFRGQEQSFWMFDGYKLTLLYGDPTSGSAWYEVLLIFRGDPQRFHKWFWPVADPEFEALPRRPRQGDSYRTLHDEMALYPVSEYNFDKLIPYDKRDCNPLTHPDPDPPPDPG